jgi:hypothetical protein
VCYLFTRKFATSTGRFAILFSGIIKSRKVDFLGMFGQVFSDCIRKIGQIFVWHVKSLQIFNNRFIELRKVNKKRVKNRLQEKLSERVSSAKVYPGIP